MTPIGKFTKTAIAVTIAGALVAPATAAFAGEKTERAILGAVIGGVAGAALGDGRGEAVAIGAVAGAALGATTAKDRNDRRYGYEHRYSPRYESNRYNAGYRDNRYAYDRYERGHDRYDNRYAYGYRR